MSDLIERQAATQTALEFIVEYLGGAFDEEFQKELIERMNALPSAQPKPKWIPCSERLPEPYEYCLWTTIDGRVVYHHCDGLFSKYIAWMPLPEPYTERREE